MATTFPQPNPWTDGEALTAALMYQRVTVPTNDAAVNGPLGLIGEASDSGTVTLAATGTSYVTTATVTFTLNTQRRIKITTAARLGLGTGTVPARLVVTGAYVAGTVATVTGAQQAGMFGTTYNNSGVVGVNGSTSCMSEWTWLVPAGTYTAFAVLVKNNGGQATDGASMQYVRVEDLGAS